MSTSVEEAIKDSRRRVKHIMEFGSHADDCSFQKDYYNSCSCGVGE